MSASLSPAEVEQYEALTKRIVVADWSSWTMIEIGGEDRLAFLHNMCTQNTEDLTPDHGREAFFCSVQGKILGYAFLFCGDDSVVLVTVPGQAAKLLPHLDKYIIREDVRLEDRAGQWSQLLVVGPQVAEIFGGEELPMGYLDHKRMRVGGVDCVVRRVEMFDVPAFMIQSEASAAGKVRQHLHSLGAVTCDAKVIDSARIAHGFPLYGRDITEKNLPQEIGREELAISFTKGCYLGQETVARIDALGHVNRRLVRLVGVADADWVAGEEVHHDGKSVGAITSTGWSFEPATAIALAIVRTAAADNGAVEVHGAAAKVVDV